jgi:molecular chaperone GrpE
MDKKPKEELDEQVEHEPSALEAERDEYKNRYLRALADYQNLKKRAQDDREVIAEQTARHIFQRLLPFLDNLEKAESFVKDDGLKMIKNDFYSQLEKEGLREIDVINKPYDPYTAEAIDIVSGKQDDIVVEVLEKGYQFRTDVLRPAKVKVSKKITS